MCADGEGNDEAQQESMEEEDTRNPYHFGSQVVDTLALTIPVKHVLTPALSFVAEYGRPERHFRERRAAVTALCVLADGCREALKDHLGMYTLP